jgi:hypothetical protein
MHIVLSHAAVWGAVASAAVAGGGILTLLLLARFSERALGEQFGVTAEAPDADPDRMEVVLRRALTESVRGFPGFGDLPAVIVLSDPVPRAWITRSPGNRGTLYLSRGFLSLLDEGELQAVLRGAFLRLDQRGVRRATCFAAWAVAIGGRAGLLTPETRPLTPRQILIAWLVLPVYSLLSHPAKRIDLLNPMNSGSEVFDVAWTSALHKASRVKRIHDISTGFRLVT